MSRKGNKADLAPSRRERKGIGQYILGFFHQFSWNTVYDEGSQDDYIHCAYTQWQNQ